MQLVYATPLFTRGILIKLVQGRHYKICGRTSLTAGLYQQNSELDTCSCSCLPGHGEEGTFPSQTLQSKYLYITQQNYKSYWLHPAVCNAPRCGSYGKKLIEASTRFILCHFSNRHMCDLPDSLLWALIIEHSPALWKEEVSWWTVTRGEKRRH